MILAIIPARSGSKRIKNKNIKIFNGKPIIGHVIENLKKINLFDRIIVSTDSERIAKISKKYGAETPFLRSKKLSNDYVATKEVIRDTIKKLKLNSKNDYVCCIYPTSVFVKQKYLKIAIKNILKRDEFFFSAKKFQHPIQRSFYKKNKLYFFNKKLIKTRTQDLTEYYHDAAQFYFAKVKTWQTKDIINPSSNFIEIPINECQDVDTLEDWKVAEILWKYLKKNHKI
tara:strand:- start:6901 stop:7584 length:684 start_codon:yes stop_codon:yes gene_type:complete